MFDFRGLSGDHLCKLEQERGQIVKKIASMSSSRTFMHEEGMEYLAKMLDHFTKEELLFFTILDFRLRAHMRRLGDDEKCPL